MIGLSLEEKAGDHTAIHPEGSMNVCTKFHSNPYYSCRDILLKNTNMNLMVVLKAKSEDLQSQEAISSGEHKCSV